MAKKLLNPLEDPPTASSSNDDEVETSSGEDEEQISDSSSSEEDKPIDPSTKSLKTPSAAAASSSDSGSETGSDSESELEEKPIVVSAAKSGKKRVSEATSSKEHAKRTKKVSGDDVKPFQRQWSDEDEISLLQGMIDFKAEKGTNPYDDMNEFYGVAKNCISFDVSKIQFGDKMRSLKNKYIGKDKKKASFSKPHEKKCFELANCFWGSNGMELLKPKDEEDKEVVLLGGESEVSTWFEKSFVVRSIASLGMDENLVKESWSKVPMKIKKRIEKKLKLVEVEECKLLLQKTNLVKEVTSVIAEAN